MRNSRLQRKAARRRAARSGFTLMEILIVLAILAVIIGLVLPNLIGSQKEANKKAAKLAIRSVEQALEIYAADHEGEFPAGGQGLDALLQSSGNDPKWKGPYVKGGKVPADPWGNPIQYQYPGAHQTDGSPDIWSMGTLTNNRIPAMTLATGPRRRNSPVMKCVRTTKAAKDTKRTTGKLKTGTILYGTCLPVRSRRASGSFPVSNHPYSVFVERGNAVPPARSKSHVKLVDGAARQAQDGWQRHLPHGRGAFTIFELLIAMAILVTRSPFPGRLLTEYKLSTACGRGGSSFRRRLAGTRVHAIDTGFDYQFRYEPGGQSGFLVIPYDQQAR